MSKIKGGILMETVRSTVSVSKDLMQQIKQLICSQEFSSITEAINMGLSLLIKEKRKEQYMTQMKIARSDNDFLTRTMLCQSEFDSIETGVSGEW